MVNNFETREIEATITGIEEVESRYFAEGRREITKCEIETEICGPIIMDGGVIPYLKVGDRIKITIEKV